MFFFIPLLEATEFPKGIKHSNKKLLSTRSDANFGYLSEDFFNMSNLFGSFRLFRHFKNDWQGIVEQKYTDNGGRNMHTTTLALDCRHIEDILDEMFTELKGMGY